MRFPRSFAWLCLALAANALGAAAELNPVPTHPPSEPEAAMEGVIVKLRGLGPAPATPGATPAPVAALARRVGLELKETRRILGSTYVMRVLPAVAGESVVATLARLRADPAVVYAEADQRRYIHDTPDDPLYLDQWYLQNSSMTPSAVDAETAWDVTTGSTGIVIADIDTGVRFEHPDLLRAGAGDGGRLLPGYDFISDLATGNTGEGRNPDASDPGDWVTSAEAATPQFSGCSVQDSSWHGTRVSGMLGAITDNALGVAGLTWSSWILPVRALGKCGGNDSDIEAAMLWAAGLQVDGVPDNPYPANIENLSLGAAGSCPQSYAEVIALLTQRGVLIVASAGNEGGPVAAPANCPGVTGVAGLRQAGTKVGYSNLGPEIALSAPAGNCGTTVAGAPCLYSLDTTVNLGTTVPTTNGYTNQLNPNLGTSFSAPIVSGVAALMLAVNGNLTASQLLQRLKQGSLPFPQSSIDDTNPQPPMCHVPTSPTDVQDSECICTLDGTTCGAGMVNASGALGEALRPIAAIVVPTTVVPGGNIVLQASGSAAACNHTITGYQWASNDANHSVSSVSAPSTSVSVPTSGSFTVILTVFDDSMPRRSDTATVVVSPTAATTTAPASTGSAACPKSLAIASPIEVSVSPSGASLQAGTGSQAFTAIVTDTTNTAVTWQVDNVPGGNATLGTINASGVYTPPANVSATFGVTVRAVSVAVKSQSGSAQVTVVGPAAQGGGGGELDALTLILSLLVLAARSPRLALRHALRNIEPFLLRPAIVRGRDARLL
jgi:serine protease